PRQYGYIAALYHPAAAVSADPVAAAASTHAGAGRIGAALRAHLVLQLEYAELSERPLVLQPLRLATAVRVRRLVRAGGSPAPCRRGAVQRHAGNRDRLSAVRVHHHADLVRSGLERLRAALARGADLPDRQGQSGRPALCSFSRARGRDGEVRPARLAVAQIALGLAADRLRAAFAGNLLPGRV